MAPIRCAACGASRDESDSSCPTCGAAASTAPVAPTHEVQPPESPALETLFAELQEYLSPQIQVVKELGRGGMGTVFLGRDPALKRLVAIKVISTDLRHPELARLRFAREAEAAAAVGHPNVVSIYHVGTLPRSQSPYFVMQYVDGQSVSEAFPRGHPVAVAQVQRIVGEVAGALATAHARGLIHRDIKPANIMLERETGRAVVLDFGISAVVQELREPAEPRLTVTGTPIGTPTYMSPEQAAAGPATPKTDVYSLGCVAFELLAGRPPFVEVSAWALMAAHLKEAPPPVRSLRSDVPAEFANLVDRALQKDPEQRPRAVDIARALGVERSTVLEWPPPGTEPVRAATRTLARLLIALAAAVAGAIGAASLAPASAWPLWTLPESPLRRGIGPLQQTLRVFGTGAQSWLLAQAAFVVLVLAVCAPACAALVRLVLALIAAKRLGYPSPVLLDVTLDLRSDTARLIGGVGRYALIEPGMRRRLTRGRRVEAVALLIGVVWCAFTPLVWLSGLLGAPTERLAPPFLLANLLVAMTVPVLAFLTVLSLRLREHRFVTPTRFGRMRRGQGSDAINNQLAQAWLRAASPTGTPTQPAHAPAVALVSGLAMCAALVVLPLLTLWASLIVAVIGPGTMAVLRDSTESWIDRGEFRYASRNLLAVRRAAMAGLERLPVTEGDFGRLRAAFHGDQQRGPLHSDAATDSIDLAAFWAVASQAETPPNLLGDHAEPLGPPIEGWRRGWWNGLIPLAHRARQAAELAYARGDVALARHRAQLIAAFGAQLMGESDPEVAVTGRYLLGLGVRVSWLDEARLGRDTAMSGLASDERNIPPIWRLIPVAEVRRPLWANVEVSEGWNWIRQAELLPALRLFLASGIVDGYCMSGREIVFGPDARRAAMLERAGRELSSISGAGEWFSSLSRSLQDLSSDPARLVRSRHIPRLALLAPLSVVGLGAVRARVEFCTWQE